VDILGMEKQKEKDDIRQRDRGVRREKMERVNRVRRDRTR